MTWPGIEPWSPGPLVNPLGQEEFKKRLFGILKLNSNLKGILLEQDSETNRRVNKPS